MAKGLLLRKRADKSDESAKAADLPGAPPGQWPFTWVEIVGDAPAEVTIPTTVVDKGIAEGWITVEGQESVIRPSGPPTDKYRPTSPPHVFRHVETIVIHTGDGDVRYTVTHQPDKYAADGDDSTPVTDELYAAGATRVDNYYDCVLES